MFTGIVEAIGTVTSIEKTPDEGTLLTISDCASILTDAHLGDSISINGTCLTITALHPPPTPHTFTISLSPETLRRTNLFTLFPLPPSKTTPWTTTHTNLERALLPSTRLGGHILQGHVDTTASITAVREDGESRVVRFEPRDQSVLRGVVEKGFVGVDGVSLTVIAVRDPTAGGDEGQGGQTGGGKGWFEVMMISYTQAKIVTARKGVGEVVNVEVDMVGKYVEKAVRGYFAGLETGAGEGGLERMVGRIVEGKMRELGGMPG